MPQIGPQQFWCEKCDCKQVDSQDKKTGKFFALWGLRHPKEDSEMSPSCVVFALCPDCLSKFNINDEEVSIEKFETK